MSDDPLDWISNYSEFTSKLKCNFRPHNPKGDMENELKALWMKDNQWMVKYFVDFNHLTAQVTWGDSHHSVQISIRYADNIVTLYRLRRPSGRPADYT